VLSPLLLGSNAALYLFYRSIEPTLTVSFREPFTRHETRPIIYVTWHRSNYVATAMLRRLPPTERPTFIAHDGIASRAFSHHAPVWLGFEVFAFQRRGGRSPREQIIDYVKRTSRPILNLPDSGGPYGKMKPGILEVARACNAVIVPFQVSASRALRIGQTLQHVLPLPFAHISACRGETLGDRATVEDCQSALDSLAS
jgi:lysophospholipid acyltransferase (LPLAT)-like uncharacterized protein